MINNDLPHGIKRDSPRRHKENPSRGGLMTGIALMTGWIYVGLRGSWMTGWIQSRVSYKPEEIMEYIGAAEVCH